VARGLFCAVLRCFCEGIILCVLWMFSKIGVLRCFAVFCGVLRACFCVKKKQHKLTKTKTTYKTHKNEQTTLCAIQRNTQYGALHLSFTQKMSAKNIRKTRPNIAHYALCHIAKHPPENTAKHCFTTKHSQNTDKTPQ